MRRAAQAGGQSACKSEEAGLYSPQQIQPIRPASCLGARAPCKHPSSKTQSTPAGPRAQRRPEGLPAAGRRPAPPPSAAAGPGAVPAAAGAPVDGVKGGGQGGMRRVGRCRRKEHKQQTVHALKLARLALAANGTRKGRHGTSAVAACKAMSPPRDILHNPLLFYRPHLWLHQDPGAEAAAGAGRGGSARLRRGEQGEKALEVRCGRDTLRPAFTRVVGCQARWLPRC